MNELHGHVVPRPDGMKARCGGVVLCSQCRIELAARQRHIKPTDEQILLIDGKPFLLDHLAAHD